MFIFKSWILDEDIIHKKNNCWNVFFFLLKKLQIILVDLRKYTFLFKDKNTWIMIFLFWVII